MLKSMFVPFLFCVLKYFVLFALFDLSVLALLTQYTLSQYTLCRKFQPFRIRTVDRYKLLVHVKFVLGKSKKKMFTRWVMHGHVSLWIVLLYIYFYFCFVVFHYLRLASLLNRKGEITIFYFAVKCHIFLLK